MLNTKALAVVNPIVAALVAILLIACSTTPTVSGYWFGSAYNICDTGSFPVRMTVT